MEELEEKSCPPNKSSSCTAPAAVDLGCLFPDAIVFPKK